MSATAFYIDLSALEGLGKRISALADIDTNTLLEGLGAEVESQTHRRIRHEKTAPDGSAWDDWSDDYAKTRGSQHSLLMGQGDLDESIEFQVHGNEVWAGSPLIYAAAQNEGYAANNLPARQYLGLSDENTADLQGIVDDFIDNHINEAFA